LYDIRGCQYLNLMLTLIFSLGIADVTRYKKQPIKLIDYRRY
jgi:hypothetical protein